MPSRSQKRSTRSSQVLDKFIVDDEDPPSLGEDTIQPNEDWSSVQDKLYSSGWKWKNGPGLISYIYMKPHIDNYKDARRDIDYFVNLEHLKEYVSKKYGWIDDEPTEPNTKRPLTKLPIIKKESDGTESIKVNKKVSITNQTSKTNEESAVEVKISPTATKKNTTSSKLSRKPKSSHNKEIIIKQESDE